MPRQELSAHAIGPVHLSLICRARYDEPGVVSSIIFFIVDHRYVSKVCHRLGGKRLSMYILSFSQETVDAQTPGWAASWKTQGKDKFHLTAH